ncbi:MAG: response regulator transcription factor [Rhodospirillales bacterium]|nr:response regulator transcription factor [Rhodospirillales bacterium]
MSGAPKPVLIADPDAALRDMLNEQFRVGGEFVAVEAVTGAEALERAKMPDLAAILLAAVFPDADGRAICRRLREAGVSVPIILLTETGDTGDCADADETITKPLRMGVVIARLRVLLERRTWALDGQTIAIGSFAFRADARTLIDGARKTTVTLTDKEVAILKFLLRAAGRVVSRDELLGEVWGYNAGVTTHTLETHVYRLRQKIERDPADARILVTEPGGYRLVS